MQRLMESEAARRAGMGSENDELVAKLEEEARQKERYISKCEENEAAIKVSRPR